MAPTQEKHHQGTSPNGLAAIVGRNVRIFRKAHGWTLEQLAERMATGIDTGSLSRLERGAQGLSIGTLEAVAHALGVKPGLLLEVPNLPQTPHYRLEEAALERAVDILGGPAAVGRTLGISGQAVSQWRRVPAERALEVERATIDAETGKPRVTRHELRPDLYPAEEGSRADLHYRLEEPVTGLGVAQTAAGYTLVPTREADTFPSSSAAQLAAQAQPVDVVRVDA